MNGDLHQSPEGLNPRAITLVVLAALVIGAVSLAVTWWMTPAPRLVRTPRLDPRGAVAGIEQGPLDALTPGQRLQARARARIHQYGWTDRDRQLVSIPIARAIDMAAAGCRPPGAGASAFDLAPDPSCIPPASSLPAASEREDDRGDGIRATVPGGRLR